MEQKNASAPIIGTVFGAGIAISGMGNPAKVLNFFDMAGSFEPSLIFVVANALVVTALGYGLVFRAQSAPVFATRFDLRTGRKTTCRWSRAQQCSVSAGARPASAQAAPYRCLASAMPRRRSSSSR